MNAQRRRGEKRRKKEPREIGIVLNKWRNALWAELSPFSVCLSPSLTCIWQFSAFTLACTKGVLIYDACRMSGFWDPLFLANATLTQLITTRVYVLVTPPPRNADVLCEWAL